jgi:hypothetical protein
VPAAVQRLRCSLPQLGATDAGRCCRPDGGRRIIAPRPAQCAPASMRPRSAESVAETRTRSRLRPARSVRASWRNVTPSASKQQRSCLWSAARRTTADRPFRY